MIKFIKYWFYMKRYEMPHPEEVMDLLKSRKINSKRNGVSIVSERIKEYALSYWHRNGNIDLVAKDHKVMRERVRQCVWRFYRNMKEANHEV